MNTLEDEEQSGKQDSSVWFLIGVLTIFSIIMVWGLYNSSSITANVTFLAPFSCADQAKNEFGTITISSVSDNHFTNTISVGQNRFRRINKITKTYDFYDIKELNTSDFTFTYEDIYLGSVTYELGIDWDFKTITVENAKITEGRGGC